MEFEYYRVGGFCSVTTITMGEEMKCPKCKGRMYTEKYYDFVRTFDAWKCSCCGEVIDPVILANRAQYNSTTMS
jgi:uncharacterized protein (DUF983 family)